MFDDRRSRWWRLGLLAGLLAASIPSGNVRAGAPPDPCPDAFPTDQLSVGQSVHGLTVEKGLTPDPFVAEVLGVLDDGIGIGIDLILVDATSPAIERAGGIWSGMSGSPVYAQDGRLIGAVAYGLSYGASSIAGVTPADAMYDLLAAGGAPTDVADTLDVPADVSSDIVERGAATSAEVAGGLARLAVPLGVSGLGAHRHAELGERIGERAAVRTYSMGAASNSASSESLVAGGNVSAALMSGAVSLAAVGTVTAVCDDDAVLFGHPLFWTGETSLGAHRADALLVQPGDGFGAGFKVAQSLDRVGTVQEDRLAGLLARLGLQPDRAVVRGTMEGSNERARSARSEIVDQEWVDYGVWYHLMSHVDGAADRIGPGTMRMVWTARGEREDGRRWFLQRHDVAVSTWDIAYLGPDRIATTVSALQNNSFEDITVDRVTYEGAVTTNERSGRIDKVQRRTKQGWVRISTEKPLRIAAGATLRLRAVVKWSDPRGTSRLPMTITIPRRPGKTATLVVRGGGNLLRLDRGSLDDFDDLLRAVRNAPSGDEVTASIALETPDAPVLAKERVRTRTVVFGAERIPLRIVRPR